MKQLLSFLTVCVVDYRNFNLAMHFIFRVAGEFVLSQINGRVKIRARVGSG